MTTFIIAVRGTVAQAMLLGARGDFLIIAIALWMLARTWREQLRLRGQVRQHAHDHDHGHHHTQQDAHELAHADEIRRRFASGNVTTGQIVMFGLSGGLIPCSAAIAVPVLCLQVNRIWLGVALVLCFMIGLAITLIAAGMIAAVGMRHFSRRWSGLGELAQRLPNLSSIVMIGLGLYVGWQGWTGVSPPSDGSRHTSHDAQSA